MSRDDLIASGVLPLYATNASPLPDDELNPARDVLWHEVLALREELAAEKRAHADTTVKLMRLTGEPRYSAEAVDVLVGNWEAAAEGLRAGNPDWADCYADCARSLRASREPKR